MARVYRHYGIVNEETGSCLEEGDSVSQISYWDEISIENIIDLK